MESYEHVAPFVLKTYQMVSDPSTDALITWGSNNNSFMVLDPFDFSQRLLPIYFKHNNFSSFVRQLNTYGFRKVDPDGWEFAHEMFLRGQNHLLKNITRRKGQRGTAISVREDMKKQEMSMLAELSLLKQGQRALDKEMEGMNRRLQATEKKPQQMMDFLAKVAEDPDILSRMLREKKASNELGEKKRSSRIASPPAPAPAAASMLATEKHTDLGTHGVPEPVKMGLIQGPPLVGGGSANDGDLYSLVKSATPETSSSTSATSANATSKGSALPMGSISQYSGNNQIDKVPFFADYWGGMESINTQPYLFSDGY